MHTVEVKKFPKSLLFHCSIQVEWLNSNIKKVFTCFKWYDPFLISLSCIQSLAFWQKELTHRLVQFTTSPFVITCLSLSVLKIV